MQSDMFSEKQQCESIKLDMPDADVTYLSGFLNAQESTEYFAKLKANLAWRQDNIKMFGKAVKIPRLQAWYGDPESAYTYSGLTMDPKRWTPELFRLKHRCESQCQTRFNSVLANLYRNERDSMGAHADNEPELGKQPIIASVSLGQVRELIFKHIHTGKKVTLPLASGSLLIMAGETQQFWQHAINKRRTPLGERINLTFRMIHPTKL